MKKAIKKKAISKRDRYTVVLEDLNSKIGLLADGQQMIQEDLSRFKVETENNFKAVFDYLSRTDDRIGNIEIELQEIKVEIKSLKANPMSAVELERVLILEQKVNMLEKLLMKKKIMAKA